MEEKEKDFEKFVSYLRKASKKVDNDYFSLPISGVSRAELTYRERVYCYELYHQLRCILDDSFPYKLNGEVDKSKHPYIKGNKKPDFIVHAPGSMKHNLVVIEVKQILSVKRYIKGLKTDIQKLKFFLNNASYYRAVIMIYGNLNSDTLPKNIRAEIEGISDKRIMVLWHHKPHEKPLLVSKS